MNGIWVRSEDGERLYAVTAFAVYGKSFEEDDGPYQLMGDGRYLATYKTQEAAMKQIDDIQAFIRCGGVSYSVSQQSKVRDGSIQSELHPYIYDLRERKVKEE